MAGTVSVRTTNVSSSSPHPMTNPAWTIMSNDPIISPNMLAAKIRPAEVMTEPVRVTVRRTPTRMLTEDSSRRREMTSML